MWAGVKEYWGWGDAGMGGDEGGGQWREPACGRCIKETPIFHFHLHLQTLTRASFWGGVGIEGGLASQVSANPTVSPMLGPLYNLAGA